MRMRFKPYAHDELMAADFHVHEPLIWGGKWHAQYARPEQPFVLELGCGKGGFISQLACAHPENNYLGIDITDKVLILAKRKIEAAYQAAGRPIDNVKIMSTDIERIKGVITAEDTVSRIYINFCNPWSKNGSPTSTVSPTRASLSTTVSSSRTAARSTSRPTTMICSATVWNTSPLPATTSSG